MILNDKEILQLCKDQQMIVPYMDRSVRKVGIDAFAPQARNVLSFGVSSFGYDVCLDEKAKIFTNQNASIIDPKKLDEGTLNDAKVYTDADGAKYVILPPNSYMLGCTKEYFKIPRDVMIVCVGKSTYARAGCLCNTTPIEPGFEGNVVIELANATTLPMKIYLNEGIAQFLFFRGNPCETSYADRSGKYMGQKDITLPRV